MEETNSLEFKREPARTFLKTVSAFANYGTGEILFGVEDDGSVTGVEDVAHMRLAIENALNDSMSPVPRFSIERRVISGLPVVALTVFEGENKPYLYRGKAYRRNDTADVEVDRIEFNRLVLEGRHLTFDEVSSKEQVLSFEILGAELRERVGVETMSTDILRTLGLYTAGGGYSNAAAMLADKNALPGIDVVRFGSNISEIRDRERFIGISALSQLHGALDMYRKYYQYEVIDGALRTTRQMVPEEAFREAVANALIHRRWDIPANIQISMESGSVTVSSPGGLPSGITFGEYLSGHVSVLRNPIIANVFYRLDYVEIFGTGVERIMAAYDEMPVKPQFSVSDNLLTVELPVIEQGTALTLEEERALSAFAQGRVLSRKEFEDMLGVSRAKAGRLLNALVARGLVRRSGSGRATRYATR